MFSGGRKRVHCEEMGLKMVIEFVFLNKVK